MSAPPIPFHASVFAAPGCTRVSVSGEVDLTTAPELRRLLTEATRTTSGAVEVDLSEVSFCDVSAVNALLVARATLSALGRQLVLLNVPEQIDRVLTLTAGRTLFEPAG